METFKQLLVPSNLCLVLIAFGAIGLAIPAMHRIARRGIVGSLLLLLLLSSGWTAALLMAPLEHAHAPVPRGTGAPGAIVVLGAYGVPDAAVPLSSWPNDSGLFRVVEAVHRREQCEGCPIMVSGSGDTVDVMGRLLESLGVPSSDLLVDGRSESTHDSARNVAGRLPGGSFYLVTSAGHMPRAMLAFRAAGLRPLPAPTDYRAARGLAEANPLPTPRGLLTSDLALHEYLGILWYKLQGM